MKINIEQINEDIKLFPQVAPITPEMNKQMSGVARLVMLDRYSFKDTEKKTLRANDIVVATVKPDPQFPKREVCYLGTFENDGTVTLYDENGETLRNDDGSINYVALEYIDKPLELFYEQIAHRNARGLASVEKDEDKERVFAEFYEVLKNMDFVPAGRVLYGAGTGTDVTYFNCFSGDTIVQTKDGSKLIKDLSGDVEVLSLDGKYRTAFFKSYGEQELYEVTFANGETIKATAGHEWYYNTKNGLKKTTTIDLVGKNIPIERKSKKLDEMEILAGIKHGIVYGDGTVQNGKATVKLFGNKIELIRFFHDEHITPHYKADYVSVYNMSEYFKQLPNRNESESYWHGFIRGLIATDGYVDDRGSFGFHSSKKEDIEYIVSNLHKTNFSYSSVKVSREISPYNGEYSPCYKVQLIKQSADADDFIRSNHRINFTSSPVSPSKASIKVTSVKPTGVIETVYCCDEPETHTFVVGMGYLTANCFVMPYPHDSREGIAQHRAEVMEIMSRGGGVGTNGSTLRPKHALARGVNGKSSGSISWLNDLAQLTHLVEQGGSRRGAQMIMLADWHPDILEFIISKMQNANILRHLIATTNDDQIKRLAEAKLKFTPLTEKEKSDLYALHDAYVTACQWDDADRIEQKIGDGGTYSVHNPEFLSGANISVAITKEFMQAVENGAEYALRFPDVENYSEYDMALYNDFWQSYGDVREWERLGFAIKTYRTIKARDLWQLINICATYSAEPGIFFIDNANDATNAVAYGQKVVATNPCGEQPLAPYSVCNLAAVNLANMVNKETKTVDFERLKKTVRVGVRMQDNVIDATPYFLEQNTKQAKGERRVGLGVMGLHDLLIYCEKVYGSPQANELVDQIFEVIAIEAYRASIELAQEKGPFPFLSGDDFMEKRSKFIESGFMKKMPEFIRDMVLMYGIRNSHLLTVAPTGSTGTLTGVSTGLEPYFAFKYYRSGRLGKMMEINAPIVDEMGADINNLPPYFVSSMELTPEAHADVQCIIQRWIDSSISKTVNAPKGYTVEQVQTVYERLYKGGAKGGTVCIDGSRDTQVLTLTNGENKKEPTKADEPLIGSEIGNTCPICRVGTVIDAGGCNTCDSCNAQLRCGL